jgi:hypothetical protein
MTRPRACGNSSRQRNPPARELRVPAAVTRGAARASSRASAGTSFAGDDSAAPTGWARFEAHAPFP